MYRFGQDDFQHMIESLTLCVVLHDARSKSILWANRMARETLGFALEAFPAPTTPHPGGGAAGHRCEAALRLLDEAARTGRAVTEWSSRGKDGAEIVSEATATRVSLAAGDVVMVQFRDIAAEEALKRELRRSESRLRAFMHDMAEGVMVLAPDGRVVFLSDAGCRILCRGSSAVMGHRFDDFCESPLLPVLRAHVPPDPSHRGSYSMRYRVRGTAPVNGTEADWRWHQATTRYVEIEDDISGYLLLFRDITAQVETETREREREREIEYLARYNAMGEMAMTIAHELSQPLAATRNFIEGATMRLARDHDDVAPIRFGLEAAARQVEHASLIIKSMRDYVVRLEHAQVRADLNEIVGDSAYFISLKCAEADVMLDLSLAPAPLPVSCEKVLIGQVILNVAFNAIEEMAPLREERRVLRIETAVVGNKAVLSVHDLGRGLPHADRERIFDGFFSGKPGGNGIGLALCRGIVSRHGGEIWAQNRLPVGTSFVFALPLAEAAEVAEAAEADTERAGDAPAGVSPTAR